MSRGLSSSGWHVVWCSHHGEQLNSIFCMQLLSLVQCSEKILSCPLHKEICIRSHTVAQLLIMENLGSCILLIAKLKTP